MLALAQRAKAVKRDGFLKPRARQVQQLVLRPVTQVSRPGPVIIPQEALVVSRYSMHEGFRALRSLSKQGHRTSPTVSGGALSTPSIRCTTSRDSVSWFS